MGVGTALGELLHRLQNPRDPILEAWRGDPFVEWTLERSGRNQPPTAGTLVSDMLEYAGVVLYLSLIVVYFYLNHHFPNWPAKYAVFAAIFLLLSWKGILRWITSGDRKPAAELVPLNEELELWLCGVRGRDLAKKYVAEVGAERLWTIVVTALLIVIVPSYVYITWSSWQFGASTALCYVLLLIWAAMLLRWVSRSTFNPFRGDVPKYFGVLKFAGGPMILLAFICVPGSLVIVAVLTLALLMDAPGVTALRSSLPYPIHQIIGLLLASVMAYCVPIQKAESLLKELEEDFERVDQDFDLYVRREILKDADAERVY